MTKEDKELLLKDLSARLPYGVVVETQLVNAPRAKFPALRVLKSHMLCDFMQTVDNVIRKPYLRPMSSMTEEEKREIYNWLVENDVDYFDFSKLRLDEIIISFDSSWLLVNWLNAHHFDYNGLIPKGLAIEVNESNNPYKK